MKRCISLIMICFFVCSFPSRAVAQDFNKKNKGEQKINPSFSKELGKNVSSSAGSDNDVANATEASEISKELLQDILVDIKKRIVINDDDAKLTYSLSLMDGSAYYDLRWESERSEQYVRYGEDKNIYSYNYYRNENTKTENSIRKLPQYSMEESRTIAKDFINKAFPKEYTNFVLEDEPTVSDDSYTFGFRYYHKDILVMGVNSFVTVNYIEGKVSEYRTDYLPNIDFENANKIIDIQQAQDAYREQIGLKKIYTFQRDEKKHRIDNVRMAYVPTFDIDYAIRAKTGKAEYVDRNFGEPYYDSMDYEFDRAGAVDIQPKEKNEIEKKSGLKSIKQARKQAEKYGLFDGSNLEVSNANLYERMYSASEYVWSLNFSSEKENYTVDLDAKTLDLLAFFEHENRREEQEIQSQHIIDAIKVSDEFITKYAPAHHDKMKLDEKMANLQIGTQGDEVRLMYVRYEGDAFLMEDSIVMAYSIAKKKIVYYNLDWSEIRLPRPTKVVDEEVVYNKIFNENKLKLCYNLKWLEKEQKMAATLFYRVDLKRELPLRFALTTGERVISAIKEAQIENYSDLAISKYPHEASTLHQIGVGFPGGELKPNIPISTKEFLTFFSSAFQSHYLDVEPRNTEEERLAKWIQVGFVLEGEEIGDQPMRREEIARYLVRALGYRKLAEKKDIFKSGLYDFEQTTPEFKGYVAIAEALRFLDVPAGGEFMPQEQATRDMAVKMVYNFLIYQ